MKITFLLPIIGITGGTRVVFEYANHLHDRGHDVSVVYPLIPMKSGAKWYNLRKLASRALMFAANLKRGIHVEGFNLKANLIRVPTLDERFIPDADIVVATWWATAHYAAKYSKNKGKKFYLIQHYEIWDLWNKSCLWDEAMKVTNNPDELPLVIANLDTKRFDFSKLRELVDRTYTLPLHKIVISPWLERLIKEKFNEPVEALIPNGINLGAFYNGDKQFRRAKRILMLYRPQEWKGADDGIRAFEIARKRHPEIQLVMFGAPRGREVPDYVDYHENIYGEDLRKLYCSCDIRLHSSWIEAFGQSPMEAVACKCALVTTTAGGVPVYAIHGKTALVSPPRSPELLAENIIELVENEELLRRISEAGYKHVRSFTWDKATDALEQSFHKVLSENRT